ncbi:MAG: hypothetical protein OXI96_01275 [Acidimicrobiaceae bacterium]|nr:hypothetical protein [Acidimicrobiaceae bacterium]
MKRFALHSHKYSRLVSSYIDNETSERENADIEANPDLQNYAEQFSALRDVLKSSPPTPTEEIRDSHINAAVEAAAWLTESKTAQTSTGTTQTTKPASRLAEPLVEEPLIEPVAEPVMQQRQLRRQSQRSLPLLKVPPEASSRQARRTRTPTAGFSLREWVRSLSPTARLRLFVGLSLVVPAIGIYAFYAMFANVAQLYTQNISVNSVSSDMNDILSASADSGQDVVDDSPTDEEDFSGASDSLLLKEYDMWSNEIQDGLTDPAGADTIHTEAYRGGDILGDTPEAEEKAGTQHRTYWANSPVYMPKSMFDSWGGFADEIIIPSMASIPEKAILLDNITSQAEFLTILPQYFALRPPDIQLAPSGKCTPRLMEFSIAMDLDYNPDEAYAFTSIAIDIDELENDSLFMDELTVDDLETFDLNLETFDVIVHNHEELLVVVSATSPYCVPTVGKVLLN